MPIVAGHDPGGVAMIPAPIMYLLYYLAFVMWVYVISCLVFGGELVVKWYDLWGGVFIDLPKQRWYLFLIPCVGVMFHSDGVWRG
jgi:hypothetical protein